MDEKKELDGIKLNDILTIDYIAKLENGKTVMSTADAGPLTFKVGSFPLVQAFNDVVIGMKIGESKKVIVLPLDAFGEIDNSLVKNVPLKELPEFIRVGQRVKGRYSKSYFYVIEVDSERGIAVLNANHVLAGEELEFTIKILSIKLSPNSIRVKKKLKRIKTELTKRVIGIPAFTYI